VLEACRSSATLEQFVLVGGDAAVRHAAYPRSIPITESEGHRAYPGCYALSKVLEEVMLEQYFMQYDLNGCCLRAPWIMAKDDLCSARRAGVIWSVASAPIVISSRAPSP
jgi:UDP-glucose 4-epimerase